MANGHGMRRVRFADIDEVHILPLPLAPTPTWLAFPWADDGSPVRSPGRAAEEREEEGAEGAEELQRFAATAEGRRDRKCVTPRACVSWPDGRELESPTSKLWLRRAQRHASAVKLGAPAGPDGGERPSLQAPHTVGGSCS
mmetsp:Transcript_16959/g.48422  ORF Transcript_16959/g.48422 Transcript_16959/m.48422 type:complete len:141 (+) Transcript_16959:63-485(+)